MPGGRFSKQAAPYISAKYLNGNNATGDSVAGGTVNSAPAGVTIPQFEQNLPGDRFLLQTADAIALSNNNIGNLYSGVYAYVGTRNNSSSSPTRGHAAFWDTTALGANNVSSAATDETYQVTSDEAANIGVALFQGVFISNITAGNFWFTQEQGKCTVKFRTAITGTPAIGAGVYLTGAGNNNNAADVGSFDQLVGANSAAIFTANSTTAYNTIDNMMVRYVGPAETLPSNNNLSIIDIGLNKFGYRW